MADEHLTAWLEVVTWPGMFAEQLPDLNSSDAGHAGLVQVERRMTQNSARLTPTAQLPGLYQGAGGEEDDSLSPHHTHCTAAWPCAGGEEIDSELCSPQTE